MEAPARIDRFVVERLLGKGGMGEVYLAFDPKLRRKVALKILSKRAELVPELTSPQTLDLRDTAVATESRLLREAQAMAQLSHPNVVSVYEIGSVDGTLFLVAEYIEGADLFQWLKDNPPVSERVELLRQSGHGLLAAHERGIVHRDFKLANVLVGVDGRARVTDFGIAIQGDRERMMRVTQRKAGTPGYMAPEIERGFDATPASDVYSFCAAFLRAITGSRDTGSPVEISAALRSRGVESAIASAIAQGFSDDPRARPSLAALMAVMAPTSRRPWLLPTVAGAAALAIAGIALAVISSPGSSHSQADEDQCPPWEALASSWTDDDRNSITVAFASSNFPDSKTAADKASQLVDGYSAALAEARTIGCEHPDPDGAVAGCFARRLARLRGSIDALVDKPNPKFVKASASFLWQLPDPRSCLNATEPPPNDAQLDHEKRLIRVRALLRARRDKTENIKALDALAADVAEGPAAMRGEVEYTKGQLLIATKAPVAEALKHFDRAHELALEAGDDALAVRCLTRLGRFTGLDPKKHEEGLKFARMANAQAVRANIGPLDRAQVLEALARLTEKVGDLEEAVRFFDEALKEIEKSSYLNVYVRGRIRRAFSALLSKVGRDDDGLHYLELAVDDYTSALGENNAIRAGVLAQLGSRLLLNKEHERGRRLLHEAKDALEASEGTHHAQTIRVRTALAGELFGGGRYDEAYVEFLELAKGFPRLENRLAVQSMAGGTLISMARYDEALVILRASAKGLESIIGERKADMISHYRWISQAEQGSGDLKAAAATLSKAEAIFNKETPDDKKTRAGLTSDRALLVERKSGCKKALPLLEAAIELRPSSDRFRDLGHCLVKTGDYKRAAAALKRALTEIEGFGDAKRMATARIERSLGYALHHLGDPAGAEMFRRSEAVLRERESWFPFVLNDSLKIEESPPE